MKPKPTKTLPLSRCIVAWKVAQMRSLLMRSQKDFGSNEWKLRRDKACGQAIKEHLEGKPC